MTYGMTGWGFILGAAGLITLIAVLAQIAQNASFVKCSERVTGSVSGKHAHQSKNGRRYTLDVAYTVDGVNYKRSVAATLSEYNALESGDTLELNYKPDKPKKVIRAESLSAKRMKTLRGVAMAAAALTALGIALFIIGVM